MAVQFAPLVLPALPAAVKSAAGFILPMILMMWGGKKMGDEDASNTGKMIGTLAHLFGGMGAGHGLVKGLGPYARKIPGFGAAQKFPFKTADQIMSQRRKPGRRVLNYAKGAAPKVAAMGGYLAPFLGPQMIQMANEPDVAALMQAMPGLQAGGGQSPDMALLAQLMGGEQGELRNQNIDWFNLLTGKDLVS